MNYIARTVLSSPRSTASGQIDFGDESHGCCGGGRIHTCPVRLTHGAADTRSEKVSNLSTPAVFCGPWVVRNLRGVAVTWGK